MNFNLFNHNKPWLKFLLLMGLFFLYFVYLVYEYGIEDGGMVTLLTWSFFVLCTPVADAGFLLDFPIRLLYKVKMLHTEVVVWLLAICFSLFGALNYPEVFEINALMKIFHEILLNPIPYWLIIVLCGIGTFLSIFLGDQVFDVFESKNIQFNQWFILKILLLLGLILSIIYLYCHLLIRLNINF